MRRETLAEASGRTIDLGAGTGANLGLYPDAVTELVLAEPDPHMLRKLRPKAEEAGVEAEIVAGRRREPALRGLQLRHRRLHPRALHGPRPGGRPGRGGPRPEAGRAPALRRARPLRGAPAWRAGRTASRRPWRFFGDGCHCNRDTVATIEAAPSPSRASSRTRCPRRRRSSGLWSGGARSPRPARAEAPSFSRIQRTIMVVM